MSCKKVLPFPFRGGGMLEDFGKKNTSQVSCFFYRCRCIRLRTISMWIRDIQHLVKLWRPERTFSFFHIEIYASTKQGYLRLTLTVYNHCLRCSPLHIRRSRTWPWTWPHLFLGSHWMWANLYPLSPYLTNHSLTLDKPPGPPPKTGYHRYIFILLEGETTNLTAPDDRQHWGTGKQGHGVRDWAKKEGLKVIGANYFIEKNKKQWGLWVTSKRCQETQIVEHDFQVSVEISSFSISNGILN